MKEMKITLGENKRVAAHYKGKVIHTDQPVRDGGDDSAPAPFDLFLASIGTCAGYYIQAYCQQRGLPTEGIHLVQQMHVDKEAKMIGRISMEIHLPGGFPEKHKKALVRAAEACTVKKHISMAPEFSISLS